MLSYNNSTKISSLTIKICTKIYKHTNYINYPKCFDFFK